MEIFFGRLRPFDFPYHEIIVVKMFSYQQKRNGIYARKWDTIKEQARTL